MKNLAFIILSILFIISCSKTDNSSIAYQITEQDLIPEGITYSSTTNAFYVSSIFKSKIIQIDAETGEFKDFYSSDQLPMRFLGMIIDESRNHLWACGNRSEGNMHYSAVGKFNIKTGELINSFMHTDTTQNIFNDLAQDDQGNIYFTNTSDPTVYKIDQQTDSLIIFFKGPQIAGANGITISPDNQYLYIASIDQGIRILDIDNQTIINEPDTTHNSTGLDGLKYYKGSIIGLQNEVRQRSDVKIARYNLNDAGTEITGMEIIDQNHPLFDIPTTFVIIKNELYCLANSQMANINWENYKIRSVEALDDIYILKYKLD